MLMNLIEITQFVWLLSQLRSHVWETVGQLPSVVFFFDMNDFVCLWEYNRAVSDDEEEKLVHNTNRFRG